MYADRNARPGGINPGSLGIALALNGAAVAVLLLVSPDLIMTRPDPPLKTYIVPDDPIPEPVPLPPQPMTKPVAGEHVVIPDPAVPHEPDAGPIRSGSFPLDPPRDGGAGGRTGTGVIDPPKPPPPLLIQPGIDQRYAALFQPVYPPEERRMGREGRVVVRVLVGIDGRVKQVERVSATSDAFFRVTLDRALAKWRFTPGTRDGVPVEAWRTMALTFVMED